MLRQVRLRLCRIYPTGQCPHLPLTDELRCAKDVFELAAGLDPVRDAKVDELNAWVGCMLVQQHDVLGLRMAWVGVTLGYPCPSLPAHSCTQTHATFRSKCAMRLECR